MTPNQPIPQVIGGRYRVEHPLGRGGMGVVYRATDTQLDRAVAIKALDPTRLERGDRLQAEARAAASIDHPYLCKIYELVEEDAVMFLVMEFVEGETLSAILSRGPMPVERVLAVGAEIAEGLHTAHTRGMVHRDVKPSNVMVTRDGHCKLLDFGLARLAAGGSPDDSTQTSSVHSSDFAGTAYYMAPEQISGGPITTRADVFALGVLLYECLTGRLPFTGETRPEYKRNVLKDTPVPIRSIVPDIPVALAEIVERCLDRSPARRPGTADAVRRELRRIERQTPTVDAGPRTTFRRTRWPVPVAVLLVLFVVVLGRPWFTRQGTGSMDLEMRPLVTWSSAEYASAPSLDGSWVAFVSTRGGTTGVYVTPADSGDPRRVDLPPGEPESLTWSADGSLTLAVSIEQADRSWQVVTVPAFGGALRASIDLGQLNSPVRLLRWIDDRVYYVVGQTLSVLELGTGLTTAVSETWTVPGALRDFDVSPDGARVTYTVSRDGRTDLWVAGIDGGNAQQVTNNPAFEQHPIWSGDGESVIYQSNLQGQFNLWEWTARTHEARPLGNSPGRDTPGGSSADGVVFSFTKELIESNLWLWSLDGTLARQVTSDTLRDYSPSVSASGEMAAFQRRRALSNDPAPLLDSTLFLAPVRDGQLGPLAEIGPGFRGLLSPDGSRLAFQQQASAIQNVLSVYDVGGGLTRTISSAARWLSYFDSPPEWTEQSVAWSPDSEGLFLIEQLDPQRQVIRQYRLGESTARPPLASAAAGEQFLGIFPTSDGRAIAVVARRSGITAVHRVDVDTASIEVLFEEETQFDELHPLGWLSDDRTFVLLQNRVLHPRGLRDLDVVLATPDGWRTAFTLTRAYMGTARLTSDDSLYVSRDEDGVVNIYRYSDVSKGEGSRLTNNDLEGITFLGLAPDEQGRILGVRERRTTDIWVAARLDPGAPKGREE